MIGCRRCERKQSRLAAFRNLLPRLQQSIRRNEIDDLDALENLATRVEASYQLSQRYRALPAPDRSLFPDLAYHAPHNAKTPVKNRDTLAALGTTEGTEVKASTHRDRRNKNRATRSVAEAEAGTSTSSASESTLSEYRNSRASTLKCWNCGEVRHFSRSCDVAPRLHCYRCGRAEITLRTCPDCSRKN